LFWSTGMHIVLRVDCTISVYPYSKTILMLVTLDRIQVHIIIYHIDMS
jgi:hypothetical protein